MAANTEQARSGLITCTISKNVLGELEHAQNQFNVPAPEANRERLLGIPLRVPREFNAMCFTHRFLSWKPPWKPRTLRGEA